MNETLKRQILARLYGAETSVTVLANVRFIQTGDFAGCWKGPGLEYWPDTYALFRYSRISDPTVFFGGIVHSKMPLAIFHSTPAVAGRRIETTLVVRGSQE